ncbi:MAG: RES family NAD+ phosphorylase [Candidatus Sulfotelmatobacter sp.]
MRVFRVLRAAFARTPFDGEGAYLYGGRWSSPGTRVAYASEHQSLAMLEYFVHLDPEDAPEDLVLATADIPIDVSRKRLNAADLPANWREIPAPPALVQFGDDFVKTAETCLLQVPSALAVHENNWLINPQHPDFREIVLHPAEPLRYDPRMFERSARRPKHR